MRIHIFNPKRNCLMNRRWLVLLIFWECLYGGSVTVAEEPTDFIPLRIDMTKIHYLEITTIDEKIYELRTTGTDPYLTTEIIDEPLDPTRLYIISFDYICPDQVTCQGDGADHMAA